VQSDFISLRGPVWAYITRALTTGGRHERGSLIVARRLWGRGARGPVHNRRSLVFAPFLPPAPRIQELFRARSRVGARGIRRVGFSERIPPLAASPRVRRRLIAAMRAGARVLLNPGAYVRN
jgi:hypothetical protein